MRSSYHKSSCMLVGLLGCRASCLTVRHSETEHDCLPVLRCVQTFSSHVYVALQHLIPPCFLLCSNNCVLFSVTHMSGIIFNVYQVMFWFYIGIELLYDLVTILNLPKFQGLPVFSAAVLLRSANLSVQLLS